MVLKLVNAIMLDLDKVITRYEAKKVQQRQKYADDPAYRKQVADRTRAWREANPDKCREYRKRQSAKRKAAAR